MRTELANLRRSRIHCHKKLKQTENLLAIYQERLARIEAAIYEIDPELKLPLQYRKRSLIFGYGELTRGILSTLREAPEPLRARELVRILLAERGHKLPEPTTFERALHRLTCALSVLRARGMIEKVGSPNKWRWRLTTNL
jgi:hypothetical protein